MKRKIFTLLLSALIGTAAMAEAPQGVIKKASVAPVLDGKMDPVWFNANTYNIAIPFKSETPTFGDEGTTTWKGLWTDEGMYIFITVNDDEFYPSYMGNVASYLADKPELYFNVNSVLVDGAKIGGHDGSDGTPGKYQIAPEMTADNIAGIVNDGGENGQSAFFVTEPTWNAEYFIPFTRFKDKDGTAFDIARPMGFDVCMIDGESAAPGVRQRANWANAGGLDESWNNMDDAGVVTFSEEIAETPTLVAKTTTGPVIDGVVDEEWSKATAYNIAVKFQAEEPTVGDLGQTTWKAMHNADGMFILVQVTDDEWLPSWAIDPPGPSYMYDQLEVYFDCNTDKKDGVGGQDKANGHLQVAPGSSAEKIDGGLQVGQRLGLDYLYSYKVTGTNWLCELFVPWEMIKDSEGNLFDVNNKMGFDITVIDRDAGDSSRKRMNWMNAGAIDESWNNMDDAGLIAFDGAVEVVYVEKVTVSGGTAITTDNGILQFAAAILPLDATAQKVKWTVENLTGKATISKEGLLKAVLDGTVKVTATSVDGGLIENSVTVTISGQKLQFEEANLVKNGNMDGPDKVWSGGDIVDGVLVCDPDGSKDNYWDWTTTQIVAVAQEDKEVPYTFSFVAWSDSPTTGPENEFDVDFEDSNNGFSRYGVSTHPFATGGTSDWNFAITSEPTRYTFDVVFSNMAENARQSLQFMLGRNDGPLYIDSVYLIKDSDLLLIKTSVNALSNKSKVQLYPNPAQNELTVSNIATANSKVSVYNAVGQKLMEKTADGNMAKFNVASLRKGMYFVRFSDGTSQKFTKQ